MRMHATRIYSQFPLYPLSHTKQYSNINIDVFDFYTIFVCRGIAKVLIVSVNTQ